MEIFCEPLYVIQALVGAWPNSVKEETRNKKPMLPLHLVCRYYLGEKWRNFPSQCIGRYYSGRNVQKSQVIHFLLRTYPAAVKVTTQAGELPLHLCLQNYFCFNKRTIPCFNKSMIALLIKADPDSTRVKDSDGNLPFHYCAKSTVDIVYDMIRADPSLIEFLRS